MKNINCEDILIRKMALTDGEVVEFFGRQINEHLATCENCRRESRRLENTIVLLKRQKRCEQNADLWPAIEKQINADPQAVFEISWQPFLLLGILLAVHKILEMVPEQDLGWALRIVPFILVAALCGVLKENPFRVNAELMLER